MQISGIGLFVTLCFKAILMLTTMEDLNLNILMSLITKSQDAKRPSTSVICCCHVHFCFDHVSDLDMVASYGMLPLFIIC